MLNKKEFEQIRTDLKEFEKKREQAIQNSREVIALSKQIIYALHRKEDPAEIVKKIKERIKDLDQKNYYETDMVEVALQEFAEAVCFYEIITKEKIPTSKELKISVNAYLLGLCDLSGELGRKAVHDAIRKDFSSVLKMREIVEEIYGEFLKFDLRNGELRKKSDSIKWNLNKLEDLVLSLQTNRQ
ncbi:hypothetical protein HZB00_00970 [Candidatus Woesearchaeota archaeon]|nr:hypothetical protein [Candidatus Woesearchaeota archaeon]